MNLLIADDSPEFMVSLKEYLENSGHAVFCASDGEQAQKTVCPEFSRNSLRLSINSGESSAISKFICTFYQPGCLVAVK